MVPPFKKSFNLTGVAGQHPPYQTAFSQKENRIKKVKINPTEGDNKRLAVKDGGQKQY